MDHDKQKRGNNCYVWQKKNAGRSGTEMIFCSSKKSRTLRMLKIITGKKKKKTK